MVGLPWGVEQGDRTKENLSSLLRSSESISLQAQNRIGLSKKEKTLNAVSRIWVLEFGEVASFCGEVTNFFCFFEQEPNFGQKRRRLVDDQFCFGLDPVCGIEVVQEVEL